MEVLCDSCCKKFYVQNFGFLDSNLQLDLTYESTHEYKVTLILNVGKFLRLIREHLITIGCGLEGSSVIEI